MTHLGAQIVTPVERLKRHLADTAEGKVTACGIGDTPGPLVVTSDRDTVTCPGCRAVIEGG